MLDSIKKYVEFSEKRRGELMSTAEILDEVLVESYISDTSVILIVRKINVHESEDGCLDVSLEFNGDFHDLSTVCFEIND